MSFRGKVSGAFGPAPKGYVPGRGRGAAGFTTRSDIGNMVAEGEATNEVSTGSRAAEQRAARLQAQRMQQQQQSQALPFGAAPKGYVAGAGRGAGSMGVAGEGQGETGGDEGSFNSFEGYQRGNDPVEGQYDDDDNEADMVWAAIDERMNNKRKRKTATVEEDPNATARAKIGAQFRELKEKLSAVSEDDWAKIPDVGDYSLKHKQKQTQDAFAPISDSLLQHRSNMNSESLANNVSIDGSETVSNMSGLGAARGTVLGMSLDKMSDSVSGQTVVDPQGYLTSLSSNKLTSSADVGDIKKARLLLKSVRDTNPKHGPGWIASARVEEAAGKTLQARKIIQEGCEACPTSEDVWLEAARLHPQQVAKSILATAVRRIPNSIKLFLKAAELEQNKSSKQAVLRKAIEANPTSITLWKAAIDLEDAEDAKVMLSVAVEKVPHSVEIWLALARLETYENARKVLNKARRELPAERSIWIAAAKLEESQHHADMVDKIVDRAVRSLAKHETIVTRSQWLEEAEAAESAGAPLTCASIVKYSIGMDVDEEDRQRTWADDARGAVERGSIQTARSILAHALSIFPRKRTLWMQSIDLERKHGTTESLDSVLEAASKSLPSVEIFWLLRAKERWIHNDVEKAREVLTQAFAANPDSESIWLAAAKLEWETGESERARVLLGRARERAPTSRVFMKSAVFEREQKQTSAALSMIEEGISKYPQCAKLYMIAGQIYSDDLQKSVENLDKARKVYRRGLQNCPKNFVLWILASRLEEKAYEYDPSIKKGLAVTKARSMLDMARLKNTGSPELWLESVRLERRTGNEKLAGSVMARALQECPNSGLLLAENIFTAPRVEQKAKSADAIKRCPEDPLVIAAVASLFAFERKTEKARKWFDRAVALNPDIGDSWARYYAFERKYGSADQRKGVMDRCRSAEPKHGEIWTKVTKAMGNRGKPVDELLEIAAEAVVSLTEGRV